MRFEGGRFEALRERLLEGGIAPRRVRRYLGELNDHLAELTEREIAAGYDPEDAALRARALLGTDGELAESWLADPRFKSLTARAPWAVIPGALVLFVALGLAICVLPWMAIGWGEKFLLHVGAFPGWFDRLSELVSAAGTFVATPLAALLLAILVWRQRLHVLWAILPPLLLLVALPLLVVGSDPHSMSVSLGLSITFDPQHSPLSVTAVAVQALLIVTPGVWLAINRYRRRRHIAHAF